MDNQSKLNLINECYDEASSVWREWFDELDEDFRFYMSDQWSEKDKAQLLKKNAPVLNINYIKKTIDLVSGFERQNKTDMKILPVEGSDSYVAEILTETVKWCMLQGNNEYIRSQAFKDGAIGGLGWLEVLMDYDMDPLNGDIKIRKISPFDLLIDPHFSESDLSDADYIIRHKALSKDKLKVLYPKNSDDIDRLKGGIVKDTDIVRLQTVPNDRGQKVLVCEYWHRVYEPVKFVINTQDPSDTQAWEGTDEQLTALLAENPTFKTLTRKIPRIKLTTTLDKQVIVYDGPAPGGIRQYPFIPIFCFNDSSYPDIKLRLTGIIRHLKDIQREKNKRRSQIMKAINSMPHSGFFTPKGSVDNINTLRNSAGAGQIIEFNVAKGMPQRIPPPDIPASLMQLEMSFDNDIRFIGANPDLLGMQQGANDPGVTIQLRQRQGMTGLQEIFDSYSYANRLLGRKILELIGENFSNEKIKRICGQSLPFDDMRLEIKKQILDIQQQKGQVQIPSLAGMVPENPDEERQLLDIETAQINAQNQIMAMDQEINRLNEEIKSITDEENKFWEDFDVIRQNARFDVTVDETANNPTFRMASLAGLIQAAQYGVPVPPEAFVELIDVSKNLRDKIMAYIQEQKGQAAQAQQMQAQAAMMKAQKNAPPPA